MRYPLLFSFFVLISVAFGQSKEIPSSYCLTEDENRLYMMINEYRSRFDLPPVPLSKSLSYLASLHVKDLVINKPDRDGCNAHSWSGKGKWKPFCYPKDETKQNSVWNKPMELTPYKGKAYEIVYWESENVIIDSVMALWREVDYFNNFLTNTGKWTGKKWNAIGIGIFENYAVAWFGELPDPAGSPKICGAPEPAPVVTDPPESIAEVNQVQKEVQPSSVPEPAKTDSAPAKPVKKIIESAKPGVYYIITLSNQPENVMNKALENARAKGFPAAKLINGDKIRLSVAEFRQKAEADSALRAVRKTHRDAWILVK